MKISDLKIPISIVAIALLLAPFPFPYKYYETLRILVTGTALFVAFLKYYPEKINLSSWLFLLIAIIYNPIYTFNFSKEIWSFINIITSLAFIAVYMAPSNKKSD